MDVYRLFSREKIVYESNTSPSGKEPLGYVADLSVLRGRFAAGGATLPHYLHAKLAGGADAPTD